MKKMTWLMVWASLMISTVAHAENDTLQEIIQAQKTIVNKIEQAKSVIPTMEQKEKELIKKEKQMEEQIKGIQSDIHHWKGYKAFVNETIVSNSSEQEIRLGPIPNLTDWTLEGSIRKKEVELTEEIEQIDRQIQMNQNQQVYFQLERVVVQDDIKQYLKDINSLRQAEINLKEVINPRRKIISQYLSKFLQEYDKTKKILNENNPLANRTTIKFTPPTQPAIISSEYGERIDPINQTYSFHSGVDFVSEEGSSIYPIARGTVVLTRNIGGYGNVVLIDHENEYFSLYAHLQDNGFKVKEGDRVKVGQTIGLVGHTGRSTGSHVHLEIWKGSERKDPLRLLSRR